MRGWDARAAWGAPDPPRGVADGGVRSARVSDGEQAPAISANRTSDVRANFVMSSTPLCYMVGT